MLSCPAAISAQNILPENNALSIGVAFTLPVGASSNDFTYIHDKTLTFTSNASYRHFVSPPVAVGALYQFHGSHSGRDLLRCHFIAPTITFRNLMDEATQSVYVTVGAGYFHYADRIYSRTTSNHTFNHGYFGASISLGYEWMIAKSLSAQIHFDFMSAKWGENEDYKPKWARENPDDPEYMFEPKMMFASLGVDIQFGR